MTLLALAVGTPVFAQTDPPEDARVLFGSLALSPAIGLTEVGWDDNLLHVAKAERPMGRLHHDSDSGLAGLASGSRASNPADGADSTLSTSTS